MIMASDIKKANERCKETFHEFGGEIKHAARYRLWLPEALSLKREKGGFLRYFTLPGKWAYDVFFFHNERIIRHAVRGFPDVRFCDNNANYFATAKRLLGNTVGIQANFETVVLMDKREFWDGFPYDIYNLDFCGTCFPKDQPPFSETFQAIVKIIEEHVRKKCFPFVVFLTMKALIDETNAHARQELIDNIESNRAQPEFKSAFDQAIPNTAEFVQRSFCDFILVSIPKLICYLARDHCNVEVRQRAKYARTLGSNKSYYIVKFVFRFVGRDRTSLRITNKSYADNVLQVVRMDNTLTIDNSSITGAVRKSLAQIKNHLKELGY